MTTTDTLPEVYIGTGWTDEVTMATVILDPSHAAAFYADAPSPNYSVTCDSCCAVLRVVAYGLPVLDAPHISTEAYTGCLSCMVGALTVSGYIVNADDVDATPTGRHAA